MSFVFPAITSPVKSVRVGSPATYDRVFHSGIGLNFASGIHYVKAGLAAPTVSPLTSLFTFTSGNQSMYMGPAGLLVASATNTPRIEYDANGNCLGLLMEAARTNLCLQSQSLDNAAWTRLGLTSVESSATSAPDGSTTASLFTENSGTSLHGVVPAAGMTISSGATVTVSAFVKAGTRTFVQVRANDATTTNGFTATFNLSTGISTANTNIGAGVFSAAAITPYINGWYRVSVTGAINGGVTSAFCQLLMHNGSAASYAGNGTGTMLFWGAQFEAAAFASSYIPTTTVSVARTADVCIRTLGSEFSATAGTVVVAGRASGGQDASNAQAVWDLDDATGNERFGFVRPAATDTARHVVVDGGVSQVSTDATFANRTAFKSAFAYAENDFASSFNGAAVLTDAAGTLPTVTQLCLGSLNTTLQGNCHILRFDYWPERKHNGELVRLSSA